MVYILTVWDTVPTHTPSTIGWGVNLAQVGSISHPIVDGVWVGMVFHTKWVQKVFLLLTYNS